MQRHLLFLSLLMIVLPEWGRAQNLWDKIYLNNYPPASIPYNISGVDVVRYSWDNIHGGLLGYVTDSSGYGRVHTLYIRLNASGDTVWTRRDFFNMQGNERVSGICRMPNGDFLIAAVCDTVTFPHYSRPYHLLKRIDSLGNDVFTRVITMGENSGDQLLISGAGAGSYYLVSVFGGKVVPGWTSGSGWGIDSMKGKMRIEGYNALDVRISADSLFSGNMIGLSGSHPCPGAPWIYLRRYQDYGVIGNVRAHTAADGGLLCSFNRDTVFTFSTTTCSYYAKPGRAGGFAYKYDSALQLKWCTSITAAIGMPADSLFGVAYSFPTADTGFVVVGMVGDTSGHAGYSTTVVKLNKNGVTTDVHRTPNNTYFRYGTETSRGELVFETNIWTSASGWVNGLTLLDAHLNFVRYSPFSTRILPPGETDYFQLEGFTANPYGGAFTPYYKDTGTTRASAINLIPGTLNFDSLLNCYPASVSGKLVRDDNFNCSYDAAIDRSLSGRIVKATNTLDSSIFYASTNSNGNFNRGLPVGNYSINHLNTAPNKAPECPPGGYPSVLLTAGSRLAGYNFYDTLRPGYIDMKVLLAPDRFRPGFTSHLYAYVTNNSGIPTSDTLRITTPAGLTYVSAMPSPISSSGNTLMWVLNNVAPDSIVAIAINLSTPASLSIGTNLGFVAHINEPLDYNQADNIDSPWVQVVGSFDPNCKDVNRPLYTATRKDWVYTIQFQNTGNYPAQDVLITDLLHPLLAPSTLRVLGASHGKPTLTWSEGHQLSFRFNNINLPDSVHDEPASHGYLTYSINPSAHAKTGDTITNAAAIYFDYNEPVITDPTNNILVQPLDVRSVATTHRFIAYPNPAARNLSIVSDAAGNAILTDMLGRRIAVYRLDSGKQQFQLPDGISTGVYILEGVNKEGETLGILRLMVL